MKTQVHGNSKIHKKILDFKVQRTLTDKDVSPHKYHDYYHEFATSLL